MQLKEPFIIFMIGTPLVGKSTFINNTLPRVIDVPFHIISRDDIIMEHVIGDETYNDVYKRIDKNQKKIDKILKEKFSESFLMRRNVVIDMTNMTRKRRHNTSTYFKNYNKYAIVFPFLSIEEYKVRNENRTKQEAKYLNISSVMKMIEMYVPVSDDEGFIEVFESNNFDT